MRWYKRKYRAKSEYVRAFAKETQKLSKKFKDWLKSYLGVSREIRSEVIVEGEHTAALDAYVAEALRGVVLDVDPEIASYLFHQIGNEAVEYEMVTLLPLSCVPEGDVSVKIEGPSFAIFACAVASSCGKDTSPAERIARAHVMTDIGKRMWQCLRSNQHIHSPQPKYMVQAIADGRRAEYGMGCGCTKSRKVCTKEESINCPFIARYLSKAGMLSLPKPK